MLSEYKDKQPLAYNLLLNDILNNCVTHAYLIDENDYSDAFGMIRSFVKSIICDNSSLNGSNCDECSLCKRIDDGNYPEVKIITADGMYIKKSQIISLQQEFSRTAVEGKKRIYIIRDCDKMRIEAANSMLKFLEEPEDGIVAILMTNNMNNVLPTIISRCKIVKFNKLIDDVVQNDEKLDNLAIDFISSLENKGIETIIYVKDLWFSVLGTKDRDKMIIVFDIMIDIYYDMMKILTNSKNLKYSKWINKISEFALLNNIEDILKKINILVDAKDSIKYNVNSNLLVDRVIIGIGGITDVGRY